MVDEWALNWRSVWFPSVLACYISFHHCSFSEDSLLNYAISLLISRPISQSNLSPLHKNTNNIKKKWRINSTWRLFASTKFITPWLVFMHIILKHRCNRSSACLRRFTDSVLYHRIKLLRADGNICHNDVVLSIASSQTI